MPDPADIAIARVLDGSAPGYGSVAALGVRFAPQPAVTWSPAAALDALAL